LLRATKAYLGGGGFLWVVAGLTGGSRCIAFPLGNYMVPTQTLQGNSWGLLNGGPPDFLVCGDYPDDCTLATDVATEP
jgi:hypothetical protein